MKFFEINYIKTTASIAYIQAETQEEAIEKLKARQVESDHDIGVLDQCLTEVKEFESPDQDVSF